MGIRIEKTGEIDTKIKIHPSFTDAWHFFKSLMIIVMCMLGVLDSPWLEANPILGLIILGFVWNGTFGLFYNYILIKKEHRKKH